MPVAEVTQFEVGGGQLVSGLLVAPERARLLYVLAHGAGAGMRHRAMEEVAAGLAERGIASFRYQFPYMEQGSKRPDPPALCHATVRAAIAEATRLAPGLALVAGGRSFGGRMTSQAQATPIPGVRGLGFLGFPLHPAGKPGIERAEHLSRVDVPMLFVSGDRDALAELELLRPVVDRLGELAKLHLVSHADHSFKTAAKSGRTSADAESEALDALAGWILRQSR